MPAARKRRFWSPQFVPNEPFEINWAHPLSNNLVGFWPLNGTLNDLVAGNNLSASSLRNFGVAAIGPVWQSASTTQTPANVGMVAPIIGSGQMSLFAQFATTQTVIGGGTTIASWGTTSTGEQMQLDIEDGVIWTRHQGGETTQAGSGYNDGKFHTVGWTKGPGVTVSGVSIFGDGIPLAVTASGSTVLNFSALTPLWIGAPFAAGDAFVGSISGLRIWAAQLSAAAFEWLTAEPWAMVQRLPRRFYSLASGGGNVSVALTGQGVTASAGTLTPALSVGLSGLTGTCTQGTLSAPGAINVALTGSALAASAGPMTPANAAALSGLSIASSAGLLAPALAVGLTGAAANTALGNLAPLLSIPLTGAGSTFTQGALGNTRTLSLTGMAVRSTPGSLSAPVGILSGDPRYTIRRQIARNFTVWRSIRRTFTVRRSQIRVFEVNSMSLRFPVKGPLETVPLTFDFSADLPSGVTLSGTPTLTVTCTEGADSNPSAILSGAAAFNSASTGVVQAAANGEDGCEYTVVCTCATTQSNLTLTLVGILPVRANLN